MLWSGVRSKASSGSLGRFGLLEDSRDQVLRLGLNAVEVILTFKTLGADFVNLFGTGRTRREPSVLRRHFDSADCRAVARSDRHCTENFLTGDFARIQLLGSQLLQDVLLRECRRRVDTFVGGRAEFLRQIVVYGPRIAAF